VKRATVKGRRTLGDGRRLINIACPVCNGMHWMAAAESGRCPRKPGSFTIAERVTR
jgi:hypothetical protein